MIEKRLLKYHHLGIPTDRKIDGEIYYPDWKFARVPGINNAYGVEWTRFDEDSNLPDLVTGKAHVAFEVDSLEKAIDGERVIVAPRQLVPGVRVAFIDVLDSPVQFLEMEKRIAPWDLHNPVEAAGKQLKYHHTGLPCNQVFRDEIKVPHLKLAYLPGQRNNYGVEWMRFDADNENPDVIKYIPHVAFEVDDIDQAIVGEKVLYHSGRDDPGVIVTMIEVDGASIEFIQLDRSIVGNQYDA